MQKKHVWGLTEDKILLQLREERNITKWSQIAEIMKCEYGIKNRTGKQCRDRYINKVSKNLSEAKWSASQETKLIQMHRQYGSRWSQIAKILHGRSQNNIKNHFYSRLRKSVRNLNKIILKNFAAQYTTINSQFLNNLILASSDRFKDNCKFDQEFVEKSIEIIQYLYWRAQYQHIDPIHTSQLKVVVQNLQYLGGINKLKCLKKILSSRQIRQNQRTQVKPIKENCTNDIQGPVYFYFIYQY